jgi:hypothetical protein
MATFPFTGDPLSQIELIYIGYFGRAGDATGTNFWISQFLAQGSTQAALNQIAGQFSQTAEAKAQYPFLASPLTASQTQIKAFIDQVYQNLFARNADPAGQTFWLAQINNALATQNPAVIAAQLGVFIENVALGATGSDQTNLAAKVTVGDYFTQHIDFASSPLAAQFSHSAIAAVHTPADVAPTEALIDSFAINPPSGGNFLLTIGQDTFHGTGLDTFNAPLAGIFGNQATLTNGDNLSDTGGTGAFASVLNATFLTGGDVSTGILEATFLDPAGPPVVNVQGVNITGIPVWNIDNVGLAGTVTIAGDSTLVGGPNHVISGLHTLNYDAHSGQASLLVGNNTQPVAADAPGAFNNFHLNVRDAVGTGDNGVNVDFAAVNSVVGLPSPISGFTGSDTIFVTANVVGGFPLDEGGSLVIPQPIIFDTDTEQFDQDAYNPNWEGFLDDAFAITAGASSGPNKGKNGLPPTGAVGFQNWVIASTGAVLLEPGIQFANFNTLTGLNIIALGGEGSFSATTLTLTDDGSSTMLFASFFGDSLLTDWKNLANIDLSGTSGFVILTGLEATTQANEIDDPSTDGGGLLTMDTTALKTIVGGAGNSFYDLSSLTPATAQAAKIDGGHSTGGNSEVAFNNDVMTGTKPVSISHIQVLDDASDDQGGTIDMNNFVGLAPLNQPYTLLAGGVIPAGFQLLQLLDADGSTDAALVKNLFILNGPTQFAVNMQDVEDGSFIFPAEGPANGSTGFDISIFGESVVPNVSVASHLILYVSDGVSPPTAHPSAPELYFQPYTGEQVYNVPNLEIDNYTLTDIWIPFESFTTIDHEVIGHDVGLGTRLFLVQPVVTVGSNGTATASVTFHDNKDDSGASPPGGPDDLYLGHTQTYDAGSGLLSYDSTSPPFHADVAPLIGDATVRIDTFFHGPLQTTLTDLGAGRLEIGATDVFVLDAHTTSHLVMDLPAAGFSVLHNAKSGGENLFLDHGITVTGSAIGQNLIQGSSGPLNLDQAALFFGPGTPEDEGDDIAYIGAVADDVLTGGSSSAKSDTAGDNFFGAGGNDIINLNHVAKGGHTSTVWIGAFDIGYSGPQETGTDPGTILDQAITDTDANGDAHNFVNGYGSSITTINGFQFGAKGDAIIFMDNSWAESGEDGKGAGVVGLTQWNGHSETNGGDVNGTTTFFLVGSADLTIDENTDVVLDDIGGGYANAAALQAALVNPSHVGNIILNGSGVAEGTTADLLIAYRQGDGITIADVTIKATGNDNITDTSELHGGALEVHDLVHVVTPLGLANFDPHNLHITNVICGPDCCRSRRFSL